MVSIQLREKVIDSYYKGLSRDENAEKNNTSGGTVSAILAEYEKDIGSENKNAIKIFARFIRKNNLSLKTIHDKTRQFSFMEKYHIDTTEHTFSAVSDIENHKDAKRVLDIAKKLTDLETNQKMSLDEIEKIYTEKANALPKLDSKIKQKEKSIKNLDNAHKEKLGQAHVTYAALEQFIEVRTKLGRHGVSFNDNGIDAASKILAELDDAGHASSLVRQLQKTQSVEDYYKRLVKDTRLLESKRTKTEQSTTSMKKKLESVKTLHVSLKDEVDAAKKIRKSGHDPDSLVRIADIMQSNKKTDKEFAESIMQFYNLDDKLDSLCHRIASKKQEESKIDRKIVEKHIQNKELTKNYEVLSNRIEAKLAQIKKSMIQNIIANPWMYVEKTGDVSNTELSAHLSYLIKIKERFSGRAKHRTALVSGLSQAISELERMFVHVS